MNAADSLIRYQQAAANLAEVGVESHWHHGGLDAKLTLSGPVEELLALLEQIAYRPVYLSDATEDDVFAPILLDELVREEEL